MAARTIVVVEDERTISAAIAERLRSEGFRVEVAFDGPGGVDTCSRVRPDAVVLDVMLPGFDGIEVCRRIQSDRAVPVLMLTARDSEADVLIGLGVGADDYMTKPFSQRELVARVKALVRRVDRAASYAQQPIVRSGRLEIDPARRSVRIDEEPVHLTPIEFDLLFHLASRPGIVHPRERLLSEVWGYEDEGSTRTVDSHVRALRKKLGAGVIRTAHGVGYALEEASV